MERNALIELKSRIETIQIEKSRLMGEIEMKKNRQMEVEEQMRMLMAQISEVKQRVRIKMGLKKDYENLLKKSNQSYEKLVQNCQDLNTFLNQQMMSGQVQYS